MRRSLWKPLLLVALIAGGLVLVRGPLAPYVQPARIAEFFRALGDPWWAPAALVAAYALGTTLGVPGTVLTFAGGAIFGFAWGSVWNWLGASLGALLAFAAARTLGRGFVARVLRGRVAALDERIGARGFQTVFYLRLIPLIPFNGLNFGAGLTRVRFRDYALATVLGIIPGTVIYTYFADAILRGSQEARGRALLHFSIAAGGLIAFTWITDLVRRRLQRRGGLPAKAPAAESASDERA